MKARRSFSVREIFFVTGAVVFFVLMMARLVDVQVVRGVHFRSLAQANRLFQERLQAERGVILDRYNTPLSYNTKVYYLQENPQQMYSSQSRLDAESALFLLATAAASVSYELERVYPFGESLSHVTGYTGLVASEDLLQDKTLHPRDRVGKLGLERVFERYLRGRSGTALYEVNALGKRQRLLETVHGSPGLSIETTIDPYLSEVAYRLLAGKKGSVVVQDAKTGEVLSLVSAPAFNATDLSRSFTDSVAEKSRVERVRSFFSNPNQLFFNRAISGAYPPGSVFKLVTAAIGLEKGVLNREKTVLDEGVLRVGEFSYANWYYTQYGGKDGEIAVVRALARSNDIYFYKAAEWIGPFDLAAGARAFGFGKPTGVELRSESAGNVPDPDWKQRVIGEQWYLGNTYHFGIGQGDVLVTPLQVAQMMQAVANRGALCAPRVVSTQTTTRALEAANSCKEIGISEQHLETVVEGMLDACSSGGTAYPFFAHNEKQRDRALSPFAQIEQGAVACKTGTAEFGGQDSRGYRKTHGWFTLALGIDQKEVFAEQEITSQESAEAGGVASTNTRSNTSAPFNSTKTNQVLDATVSEAELHAAWLAQVRKSGFPQRITITVLVESDEVEPYREGSRDAAPIAKALVEWMYSGSTTGVVEQARAEGYAGE